MAASKKPLPEGDASFVHRMPRQAETMYECKALGGTVKHLAGPVLAADHRVFLQPMVPLSSIKGPGSGLNIVGAVGPGGLHEWPVKGVCK